MLYKSKNILTLVAIGYIVGFIVGKYIEYCLFAQVVVLLMCLYYWILLHYLGQGMQVLYSGRAPRTKETLPDFLKWHRVTRHPLVFRGLTSSQRTPGFWGVTVLRWYLTVLIVNHILKQAMSLASKQWFSFKPYVKIKQVMVFMYSTILLKTSKQWF